ncbi:MAG: potassium channel protein [Bacteroidetes bacterium]|nr:potassium channel protein [Bacteroidota bacterium]MBU1115664.1 potassium channel protein [Bacteroidota bacterium]MBU1799023.1 potassium channel protein [Bacteroidota bacterium]
MRNKLITHVALGILVLTIITLLGTSFYTLFEKHSILEAFYMTIITISTTGFKEVRPLSNAGMIVTILIIISGVITIAYTGGKAAQLIIETQLFRRKNMSKQVGELKNHYIVCGYGRMGREVCETLLENNELFVVIDNAQAKIDELVEKGILFINGDASSDSILIQAGIKNAKGLATVVKSDAENVFVTLTARELNKSIYIVARAIEDRTESKLIKAGASRVVKPYEIGGKRIVHLLLKPGVTDFIEDVARKRGMNIHMEEISITKPCPLVNKTLAESPLRKDFNVMVIAINKSNSNFIYNPRSVEKIEIGDKLIVIGETDNLAKLNEMVLGN